jgi:putative ABC transport system substrate-binding protein
MSLIGPFRLFAAMPQYVRCWGVDWTLCGDGENGAPDPSGHRPDRNLAAQQSPAVAEVCYPFCRKHRRHRAVKRREFITLFGSAAAWPVAARAQQASKLPTIGFLGVNTPAARSQLTTAFVQRLRDLGWVEDRTVIIQYRRGEGRAERYAEIAAEFVRLKVDVIFTDGTATALAAKQTTSLIPIVFGVAGDPLGTGLVASLARPGGNVTGLSNQAADLAAKRLELLREIIPNLRRMRIMAYTGYLGAQQEVSEIQAAARTLGVEVAVFEIRRAEDIARGFEGHADALYVVGDSVMHANRVRLSTLALVARLPTIYVHRDYVEAGGLISYGANLADLFRNAAGYVDKILRGAKPADLPVEQPTKFDLVVNLITAKALGIDVPPTLLARADEVIE